MGGLRAWEAWGVRDPVPAAVTISISTQSRIIPKVEDLLEDHLKQPWAEDPELNYIWDARGYLVNQEGSQRDNSHSARNLGTRR